MMSYSECAHVSQPVFPGFVAGYDCIANIISVKTLSLTDFCSVNGLCSSFSLIWVVKMGCCLVVNLLSSGKLCGGLSEPVCVLKLNFKLNLIDYTSEFCLKIYLQI